MGDSKDLDNRGRVSVSRDKDSVNLDKEEHGETNRELSIMLLRISVRGKEVKVGEDKVWAADKVGEAKVWAVKEWVDKEWVDKAGEDSNPEDRAGEVKAKVDRAGEARVKVDRVDKAGEVKAKEVRAGEDREARAGVQARKVSDDDDDKLKSL